MSEQTPKRLLTALPQGLTDRTWTTAKLAARLGVAAAKKNFGLGTTEEATTADSAASERRAAELAQQMGQLKGLVMKIGQMASYLPGALPPSAQKVLAELQTSTEPMDPAVIEAQLQAEFGQGSAALFRDFEPTPFAAASIGQVHRATYEGQRVAVKVQYPGIEDALRSDLRTAKLFASVATVGSRIDSEATFEELRTRLLEECDYRLEARNQRVFQRVLSKMGGAHVPSVIDARSTRRVLTTEFVHGQRFLDFIASSTQAERDRAGACIYRACILPLFRHGLFNADPHPGNYLFADDGTVTFLDFGCARTFSKDFIDRWKALTRCVTYGRKHEFRERFIGVRFADPNDKKFDFDAQWEALGVLYRPMRNKNFRFSREFVRETYDALMFRNPNKLRITMPPEWLFLNRLQWGLFAILAELGAGPGIYETWREAIESVTEPIALENPA